MRRRSFLALASSAAICPALAQPRPPILGVINDAPTNAGPVMTSLLRGLGRHELISNQTVLIVYQNPERYEDAPAAAEALVKRGAAAIVTLASPNVALAAQAAAKSIPVIFATTGDPVKLGLVASLDKPGANMTGVALAPRAVIAKRADILGLLTPAGKKAGLLVNPDNRASAGEREAYAAVREIITLEAADEASIEAAFARAAREGVGALAIAEDARLNRLRDKIIAAANRTKIATVHATREGAAAGGVAAHGDLRTEQMIRLGDLAGRALKGGKPESMAVAVADRFETVINAKAAAALGIEAPAALRSGADVIQ